MPRSLRSDNLQGTLDLLVLKTLGARAPLHGYAIASHIQQITDDVLRVEEGSLYPALHRIEGLGWISSEWSLSPTNRRAELFNLNAGGRGPTGAEPQQLGGRAGGARKVLEN